MTNALVISTPEKLLAALRLGLAFVALEMLGSTLEGALETVNEAIFKDSSIRINPTTYLLLLYDM